MLEVANVRLPLDAGLPEGTALIKTAPAAISLAAPALHQWVVSGLSTARSTAEFISSAWMTQNTASDTSAKPPASSPASADAA